MVSLIDYPLAPSKCVCSSAPVLPVPPSRRNPPSRAASAASRSPSRPGAIATCTTWSRPNTRPSAAAEKSCAFRRTAIRRLQDQPAPTRSQTLARLVEPRDRLPGTASEPEQFADPPDQRRLEHGRKIGGHDDRAARGPGEGAPQASLSASGFYHIPGRAQPDSPPGQGCYQVRHQTSVGRHDEADHPLLRQAFPRDDAAAQRAGFGFIVRCLVCRLSRVAPPVGPLPQRTSEHGRP